jgi:hypothetical protein
MHISVAFQATLLTTHFSHAKIGGITELAFILGTGGQAPPAWHCTGKLGFAKSERLVHKHVHKFVQTCWHLLKLALGNHPDVRAACRADVIYTFSKA